MNKINKSIIRLMNKKEFGYEELSNIILSNYPKGISDICNFDENRLAEIIFSGEVPNFLETILIMEAMGFSISDIFSNFS